MRGGSYSYLWVKEYGLECSKELSWFSKAAIVDSFLRLCIHIYVEEIIHTDPCTLDTVSTNANIGKLNTVSG